MEDYTYKTLEARLDKQDDRINSNEERLRDLEQYRSGTEQRLENLVDKINSLVTTMRWFIGLLVGSFVGFFFYAVQSGIL